MGREKEFLIMKDDYRRFILDKLEEMDAVRVCPSCGIEYLTGKNESLIYATITNAFKKKFGEHYNNYLMKDLRLV